MNTKAEIRERHKYNSYEHPYQKSNDLGVLLDISDEQDQLYDEAVKLVKHYKEELETAEAKLKAYEKLETVAMLLCNATYQSYEDTEPLIDKLYKTLQTILAKE